MIVSKKTWEAGVERSDRRRHLVGGDGFTANLRCDRKSELRVETTYITYIYRVQGIEITIMKTYLDS